MARSAAAMLLLTGVFWFVSWPWIPMGSEFPNCASGRIATTWFSTGALSINGKNCFFNDRWHRADELGLVWTERRDGHFCGFPVPPFADLEEPRGLSVTLSATTIAFHLPHWLIATIWLAVLVKYTERWQFGMSELGLATLIVAVCAALVRLKCTLPLVVFLNLTTVAVVMVVLVGIFCWLWKNPNPLWPLLNELPNSEQLEPEVSKLNAKE